MATTVPSPQRHNDHGKVSAVDIAAARRLGVRPATIHDRIHRRGIHVELAAVIACAVEAGHLELADRLADPIIAARQRIPVEPLTPALILEVQRVDVEEDIAEAVYLSDPSSENLGLWLRWLDKQQAAHIRLRRAVRAHQETRA